MRRFAVGELVGLNGLLEETHSEATGRVVSVIPHKGGISVLDVYEVALEDSEPQRVWLCRFQLTHVKTEEGSQLVS